VRLSFAHQNGSAGPDPKDVEQWQNGYFATELQNLRSVYCLGRQLLGRGPGAWDLIE
jgi:hypothetical protein